MIFGQYPTIPEELASPVWQRAFSWITQNAQQLSDGEHEIIGRDMYANIHTATTMPESEGVFEVHKEYIDLHYCLSGGEIICHSPIGVLAKKTPFDTEKDYQLFLPPKQSSNVTMQPKSFAIFFPGELHMPKVTDGTNKTVQKVVVKIKASLL
ncbi:MAG: hypothetical protein A3C02_01085 [Candidatus Andersenbacteria bacterium RIFCSPHIGHO2_02_FULL_45_11]|uniref:YhcH/YjgK/YiaL family protein n=1 Tax=Candidatus Andersenbacteria bacterium RIFCSPHIGHO2_12_FULL_45_11 TaxID=1797281 RepID=A0A1G1X1H8_9BACT|nr:MAG: hypothetical protein A2805_04085 [Candidatus Andersenbacteria bacterium RIFCSPHIGHO2_01_FULL_46_36]OGY33576.1 MAG: hypothetical protein A3C02_01085 [Candidatus Andersenbacteria bacterium RIFCSPHIGHO2_02_FULL_45_11]OGY33862.1 MAG: hypothetical protein A3D99_03955 [Candidatus Andersenbacteria bacterium RIFCSPHIGHO2_12_FULL_45_11]